ncbi:MAG: hypothetical protein MUC41_03030 [Syntrophobacteraceae bacterium]|jgi:hypothetical protein|nr:hypothetical protein [Syntrophobacteraceae bacterium]
MNDAWREPIDPIRLAFDIDGVVADTMAVFVRLARERYGLTHLTKDDLRCYELHECLDVDREVLNDLICLTLDDEHTLQVPAMEGATEVLTRLARHGPLRFVTARIWPESITRWLHLTLHEVPGDRIQVIATGAPEAKRQVLHDLGIQFFLEDRLETCRHLALNGIQPFLYDQPWNRLPEGDEFPRIVSWDQFGEWVFPGNGGE